MYTLCGLMGFEFRVFEFMKFWFTSCRFIVFRIVSSSSINYWLMSLEFDEFVLPFIFLSIVPEQTSLSRPCLTNPL